MKKTATVIYIILVIVPLFIFFNPFAWGMRRMPIYRPTENTLNLIRKLDDKYKMSTEVTTEEDTLWYFRDVRNHKITKLKNFQLEIQIDTLYKFNRENIKNFSADFSREFEHKKYYDSLIIVNDSDSILYKVKMK